MTESFWSFAVQTEGLTEAGLDSPNLKGVKGVRGARGVKGAIGAIGDKVAAVEVSGVEEEEEETDPNFLLRSWMPSWMLTMLRCVLGLHKIIFILHFDHTVNV